MPGDSLDRASAPTAPERNDRLVFWAVAGDCAPAAAAAVAVLALLSANRTGTHAPAAPRGGNRVTAPQSLQGLSDVHQPHSIRGLNPIAGPGWSSWGTGQSYPAGSAGQAGHLVSEVQQNRGDANGAGDTGPFAFRALSALGSGMGTVVPTSVASSLVRVLLGDGDQVAGTSPKASTTLWSLLPTRRARARTARNRGLRPYERRSRPPWVQPRPELVLSGTIRHGAVLAGLRTLFFEPSLTASVL